MPLEAGDQGVQLLPGHHAAGRVGRAVDDDQPGAIRDLGEHLLGREREAALLVERDRHRLGAAELDHRAIDRKARVRIHDLGARLAEHGDREVHRDLAAGHDHDPVGVDLDAAILRDVLGDRLAQRQDAVRRGVAVMAVGQRLLRRGDDVLRRREIRLADAEIDDVATLLGEPVRPRQHFEGTFGAEPVHAFRENHSWLPVRAFASFLRTAHIAQAARLASAGSRLPKPVLKPAGEPRAARRHGTRRRFRAFARIAFAHIDRPRATMVRPAPPRLWSQPRRRSRPWRRCRRRR